MKHDGGLLLTLLGYFALMSLFAIGGANGAIPEMHRLVVETTGWMTDRQFADMFAMAQVTPGPNVIIVTLIGYHVPASPGLWSRRWACAAQPVRLLFWWAGCGTASKTRAGALRFRPAWFRSPSA